MKTLIILLALIVACTAYPKGNPPPKRYIPGTVVFFYDDKCTESSQSQQIFPNDQYINGQAGNNDYVGGLYGSRSAWFTDTGHLKIWYIMDDPKTGTRSVQEPKIQQCVAYDNGIYAAGA